ncbi:uncharacterized protein I303_108237 [Kwoniella dejecticola CBS 10117]|uniref:Uncharacterized protein n=1 Tax=Kwoniella dejecticola CBS 10117 TaxID=1296121 RepID=A0A1A5ZY09_9TREE|nr:uncharacterized protein I303_07437 [Kwoniella dejecticola CBS 10117]OBR82673.1 hypothetical protein I303_07437 [Kwoniella dejecticola CBS 10117]
MSVQTAFNDDEDQDSWRSVGDDVTQEQIKEQDTKIEKLTAINAKLRRDLAIMTQESATTTQELASTRQELSQVWPALRELGWVSEVDKKHAAILSAVTDRLSRAEVGNHRKLCFQCVSLDKGSEERGNMMYWTDETVKDIMQEAAEKAIKSRISSISDFAKAHSHSEVDLLDLGFHNIEAVCCDPDATWGERTLTLAMGVAPDSSVDVTGLSQDVLQQVKRVSEEVHDEGMCHEIVFYDGHNW